MLPQGLVRFFPDPQEILGVGRNLLISTEDTMGSIGHRWSGPETGVFKRRMKDGLRAVGVETRPDSTA